MVDVAALIARTRGMIAQPEATLTEHADPLPPWQVVASQHALPIIIASAVISSLLFVMLAPALAPAGIEVPGLDLVLVQLLLRVAINFLAIAVMAGVVMTFSGMFGGSRDFNAAFMLVALAMTPHYVAEAILPVPLIGPIVAIVGLVYSLVVLYRGVPIVLHLPPQNRGKHFFMSLLSLFLITLLAGLALGPLLLPAPT